MTFAFIFALVGIAGFVIGFFVGNSVVVTDVLHARRFGLITFLDPSMSLTETLQMARVLNRASPRC
jgi:hypothetical protein